MHYPHGDGSPDRHMAEMCDLKNDPLEVTNLAEHKDYAAKRKELESRLAKLLAKEGLTPESDKMPLDEGIKTELPDQKIR